MKKFRIFEMTRPEVEQAISTGMETVIITFGSTEQHGLHLPLGTDSIWGEQLGDRIAEELGDALLAPGVRIGCSEHHMSFAGSLTLREETFIEVTRDICNSLVHHGFRQIVLIPTHGGNFSPLKKAVLKIQPELPLIKLIAFTDLNELMQNAFMVGTGRGLSIETIGGHAGEHETSLLLAIRPDLVQMNLAEPGFVGDISKVADLFFKNLRGVTANGILGDPRPASVELGKAYMESMVKMIVEFVKLQRK